MQVLFYPLHRLHLERHITIHGAEFAFVMGAALSYLQQWKCLPILVAVNCSCKVHISPSLKLCHKIFYGISLVVPAVGFGFFVRVSESEHHHGDHVFGQTVHIGNSL